MAIQRQGRFRGFGSSWVAPLGATAAQRRRHAAFSLPLRSWLGEKILNECIRFPISHFLCYRAEKFDSWNDKTSKMDPVGVEMGLSPIAVFGFNRPDKLSALFDSLARNPEFEASAVYVFIDGPRDERDLEKVEACRDLCLSLSRPNWRLEFSPVNKGCRQAIYDGVSAILAENTAAIILEDDIVISPVALAYFNEGLRRYADTPRVWSVCGYAYKASAGLNDQNRAFFLPFSHPWGWATWKSRWVQFDLDEPRMTAEHLKSVSFRRMFNVAGLIDAASLLDLEQRELVSCWDIRWYWRIFQAGGLSLFPSRGYTTNTGIGGQGGTHSSGFSPYQLLSGRPLDLNPHLPRWPEAVEIDFLALDAMRRGPDSRAQRIVSSLGRIKRVLFANFKSSPARRRQLIGAQS